MTGFTEALSRVSYPGRGIVTGEHTDGKHAVLLYFIMGRSENSRNRVFAETEDGIRTQAFDESKMQDPSLIIYRPVRKIGCQTIVTNGDQTDTIADAIVKLSANSPFHESVHAFDEALRTRAYEPDAPNFTPRISGLVHILDGKYGYALNILKADEGKDNPPCLRFTYAYETAIPGRGHFIHTYQGDGSPLPSFHGEPECVRLDGDIDTLTGQAWDALDQENKVSLFVRFIDIANGSTESRIVNQHKA